MLLSLIVPESIENDVPAVDADFVGEANGLSGKL